MATDQKDNTIKRTLIVHILIKSLLDPKDLKQLRVDLEDLVIKGVINEIQSKKIREIFRDLISDLDEITPIFKEDNIRINTIIASLKEETAVKLSLIAKKPFNYTIFNEVKECLSDTNGKLSLPDCKSIINYFKQNKILY
jgi:hypothetical protein